MNVPKAKKAFCKDKNCKKHTMHKVTQYKTGKASLYAQGKFVKRVIVSSFAVVLIVSSLQDRIVRYMSLVHGSCVVQSWDQYLFQTSTFSGSGLAQYKGWNLTI